LVAPVDSLINRAFLIVDLAGLGIHGFPNNGNKRANIEMAFVDFSRKNEPVY